MKQLLLLILILFVAAKSICQMPCSEFPTEKKLLELMAVKPIIEINPYIIKRECNLTDTLKKRLVYLLNKHWTKQELEDYINNDLIEHKRVYEIEKIARELAVNNDAIFKKNMDSLTQFWKLYIKNEMQRAGVYEISNQLILTNAALRFNEAKYILNKAYKNKDTAFYDMSTVELALARMGNKTLEKKIINECKYLSQLNGFDWMETYQYVASKLFFINTQESMYAISKWLDAYKEYVPLADGDATSQSASTVLQRLRFFISNKDFQKLTSELEDFYSNFHNSELILKAKKWMKENRGEYILNPDLY